MSFRERPEVYGHELAGRPSPGGAEAMPGLQLGGEVMPAAAKLVDASGERLSYRRPEPAPTAADAPFRAAPRATFVSMYDELAQRKADLVAARPAIASPVSWDKVFRRSVPAATIPPAPCDPYIHGQKLRGHELAHVVQQSQGRALARGARGGMGNEEASLDSEGAWRSRAVRGEGAEGVGGDESAGAALMQRLALSGGGGLRSRDDRVPRRRFRGAAPVYKLLQYTGYHIKLHPVADHAAQPWDALHVTFELFPEDPRCPKVYFDEHGARLVARDADRVNADYRLHYAGRDGRPTFTQLIERAQSHINGFLRDDAPALIARELALAGPADPHQASARPPAVPAIQHAVDDDPRPLRATIANQVAPPRHAGSLWQVCVPAFLVGIVVAAAAMLGLWELGML